ncbi:hypothetical protein LY76DRAFT_67233 [Colletotrichum caudatum]|nr:hypothetical protein LY76DRAFT_67233 [Colletotrichum caudatum]
MAMTISTLVLIPLSPSHTRAHTQSGTQGSRRHTDSSYWVGGCGRREYAMCKKEVLGLLDSLALGGGGGCSRLDVTGWVRCFVQRRRCHREPVSSEVAVCLHYHRRRALFALAHISSNDYFNYPASTVQGILRETGSEETR